MHLKYKIRDKKESFGLDIGYSGVRLAQVSKNAQGLELKYLSFKDFPIQSEPIDSFILINLVKELIKDAGINLHKAVVNLYGANPIIKFLKLPLMSDEELKKAIKWEVSKFIVYDLDKMIIDYAVLNELEEDGKKKLNIIVVASAKESVLNEINILTEAGIELVSIEIDTLAQFHMSKVNEIFSRNENMVFIEIGAKKTNINVIDGGIPCFSRECLTIGSMDINKALKEVLGVDLLEAEKIKQEFFLDTKEPAEAKDKIVYDAIRNVLSRSITEIRRSLDYYMDIFPQKTIDKAILTGGGACLKNIDVFLSHNLGLKVEIINPFKKLGLSDSIKNTDIIRFNSPRFSTVVGLALEAFA